MKQHEEFVATHKPILRGGHAMSHSPALAPEQNDQDWSERRADARRNHARIISAAVQVFAERGLEATVPDVAERAGVGKATVYRSYPTKTDLIAAVARHQLSWLESRARAAAGQPATPETLRLLLCDIFERLACERVLAEVLPKEVIPGTRAIMEHVMTHLDRVVETQKAAGHLRPDATAHDLRVMVGGCARQLTALGDRDPARWRRYGELIANALRPSPGGRSA